METRRVRQLIREAARQQRLMDPEVTGYWMSMNEKEFEALVEAAKAPSRIYEPILVRELFIGGLKDFSIKKL